MHRILGLKEISDIIILFFLIWTENCTLFIPRNTTDFFKISGIDDEQLPW